MNIDSAPLSAIIAIFAPISLGIGIGYLTRQKFEPGARRDAAAQVFEAVALKLLLPFFFIEAITRNSLDAALLLGFLAGVALPLAAVGATHLAQRWIPPAGSASSMSNPAFPYLVGTFGGGNRGTALFMLLLFLSADFSRHIAWFAAVDLGNFVCQYTIVALLMHRSFRGKQDEEKKKLWRRLLDNYAVIAVLAAGAFLIARGFIPKVEDLLHHTVAERKGLFGVLVFAAITIRFDAQSISGTIVPDVARFALLRLAVILPFVVLLALFLPASLSLLLSLVVIAWMPPSSATPAMLAQAGAPESVVRYASSFAGATNILYLVALVFCATATLARVLESG